MRIKKATLNDMPDIMLIISAAKQIMRTSGNLKQWNDGYPDENIIKTDIEAGYGYICLINNKTVAYFATIPGPDSTYSQIYEGNWINDTSQYYVIHRIASTPDSHNVFNSIINHCQKFTNNLRIDTHRDNKIMQHCILKNGFKYCGIIHINNGDERLAYQKLIL